LPDTRSSQGLIGLGIALAVGLVMSASIFSCARLEAGRQDQSLEVKGFAERPITSDFAIWRGRVTSRATALAAAYSRLERDRESLEALLRDAGFAPEAITVQPAEQQPLYEINEHGQSTNRIEGYALHQQVEVASPDVDRVVRAAGLASGLGREGIEITSSRPEFIYRGLGELKIAMLAEATADARVRAETLAEAGGGSLGTLVHARQGVFQITPAHSTDVSDYGRNDTTTRDKSIKAVVTVRYALE
jgi:hypothetical protein